MDYQFKETAPMRKISMIMLLLLLAVGIGFWMNTEATETAGVLKGTTAITDQTLSAGTAYFPSSSGTRIADGFHYLTFEYTRTNGAGADTVTVQPQATFGNSTTFRDVGSAVTLGSSDGIFLATIDSVHYPTMKTFRFEVVTKLNSTADTLDATGAVWKVYTPIASDPK
jgi:hypothetical protein